MYINKRTAIIGFSLFSFTSNATSAPQLQDNDIVRLLFTEHHTGLCVATGHVTLEDGVEIEESAKSMRNHFNDEKRFVEIEKIVSKSDYFTQARCKYVTSLLKEKREFEAYQARQRDNNQQAVDSVKPLMALGKYYAQYNWCVENSAYSDKTANEVKTQLHLIKEIKGYTMSDLKDWIDLNSAFANEHMNYDRCTKFRETIEVVSQKFR